MIQMEEEWISLGSSKGEPENTKVGYPLNVSIVETSHYAKRCPFGENKSFHKKNIFLKNTIVLQMRVISKKVMQEKFST